jgi:hypothetical protein
MRKLCLEITRASNKMDHNEKNSNQYPEFSTCGTVLRIWYIRDNIENLEHREPW